MGARRHR